MAKNKKNVDDVSDLNKLSVPILPLRAELSKLQKEGLTEYPLGELILIIREIVRSR